MNEAQTTFLLLHLRMQLYRLQEMIGSLRRLTAGIPGEDIRWHRVEKQISDLNEVATLICRSSGIADEPKESITPPDPTQKPAIGQVVYAWTDWGFVFWPDWAAKDRSALFVALHEAKTWIEFLKIAGERNYGAVFESLKENGALDFGQFYEDHRWDGISLDTILEQFLSLNIGERIPEEDDLFCPDDIPGFSDGVWPGKEIPEMTWVPEEIKKEFGTVSIAYGKPYARFLDETREKELIQAFEKHGFRCRMDEDFVLTAIGPFL
jgi:hypothetical protein